MLRTDVDYATHRGFVRDMSAIWNDIEHAIAFAHEIPPANVEQHYAHWHDVYERMTEAQSCAEEWYQWDILRKLLDHVSALLIELDERRVNK